MAVSVTIAFMYLLLYIVWDATDKYAATKQDKLNFTLRMRNLTAMLMVLTLIGILYAGLKNNRLLIIVGIMDMSLLTWQFMDYNKRIAELEADP